MGIFDDIGNAFKKAADDVFVKPAKKLEQLVKTATNETKHAVVQAGKDIKKFNDKVGNDIKHTVKQAGKDIENAAKKTEQLIKKVGPKVLEVGNKALDFTAAHAGQVAKVGKTIGKVVTAIGVATGQPEIVAVGDGITTASVVIEEAGVVARKLQGTRDKVKMHIEIIKKKKDLSSVLHGASDVLTDVGGITGNHDIQQAAIHIKQGANVVDRATGHMEQVLHMAKDVKKHLTEKDIKALVQDVRKGGSKIRDAQKILEGRQIPKTSAELLLLLEEFGGELTEAEKPKKQRKKAEPKKAEPKKAAPKKVAPAPKKAPNKAKAKPKTKRVRQRAGGFKQEVITRPNVNF